MFNRLINLPKKHGFFLFGARGTGKTSLLQRRGLENALYIDLLNLENEARYQLDPEALYKEISGLPSSTKTVIVDEIQKVPKLLDVVHRKIEETDIQFILTGSSARKLKQGGANLLAGRAFVFNLFPLLAEEIGQSFNLSHALQFGTLPRVVTFEEELEKRRFLKAYAHTYLKEEVWGEQLIRKIEPFRRFLQVAAQSHGQVLNFSKIARDVGVDDSTVRTYYSILEDTLLGFFLPAYSGSVRKQLRTAPKFYLFDNGIKRTLEDIVDYELAPGSFELGIAFEQFVISEILRRLSYRELSVNAYYLATEGGAEIDLLLGIGKKIIALIEIKSAKVVKDEDLRHLRALRPGFKGAHAFCFYTGSTTMKADNIEILPWLSGVSKVVEVISGFSKSR